ncbi:MAG: hypothetical protein LBU81_01890 [Methanosarcinales archaeon]|jgi:hypothetical protein|nr:hypothetical protein [Methanosarcinales archaeon]
MTVLVNKSTILTEIYCSILMIWTTVQRKVTNKLKQTMSNWRTVMSIAVANAYSPINGAKTIYKTFYAEDAVERGSLTDAVVGLFVFGMVLVAAYIGIGMVEPYLPTSDGTLDADAQKTLDTIRAALGIAGVCMIFISLGLLIATLRSW